MVPYNKSGILKTKKNTNVLLLILFCFWGCGWWWGGSGGGRGGGEIYDKEDAQRSKMTPRIMTKFSPVGRAILSSTRARKGDTDCKGVTPLVRIGVELCE